MLVLRQVKEDLDDPGAVTVEMLLQVHNGTIPLLPIGLLVLAPLRIDPGRDVPGDTVLAGSVHSLKNQQQCIAAGRVVKALQRAQLLNVFSQEYLIPLQKGFAIVGHSLSLTFSPGRTRKSFALIFIFILSVMSGALFASDYLCASGLGSAVASGSAPAVASGLGSALGSALGSG
jgi:hypothetical protein